MALRHVLLLAAVVAVTVVTASGRAINLISSIGFGSGRDKVYRHFKVMYEDVLAPYWPYEETYGLTIGLLLKWQKVNISNTWMLPEEGFPVFYRYFRDRISWYEADAVCQFHHGNLVTVDSTSQYDAIRAYLKELDVTHNVWIGLSRNAEKPSFKWTDFRPLSGVNSYWQEALPTGKEALCAAMDPAADFRWHALPCGGPSSAPFICELPVPSRATGPDGCLPTGLPSLTVVFKPETGALVLTSDCGKNVTKTVYCKGDANRDALVRLLTCTNSNEDFDEIPTSTSFNTHQETSVSSITTIHPNAIPTKSTKSWTSNTIGSNEYGLPTRHRRETEDTMSPTSTRSTTQEIAVNEQLKKEETKKTFRSTTATSMIDLVTIISSTTTGQLLTEHATSKKSSESTTIDNAPSSTIIEDQAETYVSSTTSSDMKAGSDMTNIDNGDYQSAINQGQLFSIIENGGMFDIIELNETNEENKTAKASDLPPTTTTESGALYTTVMYHKEPPSEINIATSDLKGASKETSPKRILLTTSIPLLFKDTHKIKTNNDLSTLKDDKTLNKEVETFPIPANPYAKLNRTYRKELPMIEFLDKDNADINLDLDNTINAVETAKVAATSAPQKEVAPVDSLHHTVEIHIHKDGDHKETLFVTTKKRDKPESTAQTKKSTTAKPDITASTTEAVRIDPKIDTLNAAAKASNATAVNETEVISLVSNVADRIREVSSEEIMKDQLPVVTIVKGTNHATSTKASPVSSAIEGAEADQSDEDESQQKPNRQRQLTRPQRRSFYPYFFSRVLG